MSTKQAEMVVRKLLPMNGKLEALHFVALLPMGHDDAAVPGPPYVQRADISAIETMLGHFGLVHGAQAQIALWTDRIPDLHRAFQLLQASARSSTNSKTMKVSQIALDVEVGGILYAAAGELGWVYAATLNQQSMNSGRAESMFTRLATEICEISPVRPREAGQRA